MPSIKVEPDIRSSRKRILFISLSTKFGGGEVYLEQLIQLTRGEIEPVVVCIHPEVRARMRASGVRFFYINLTSTWGRLLRLPAGLLLATAASFCLGAKTILLNGFAPAALAIPLRIMGRHVVVIGHLNLDERKTLRQRLFHHRRYLTSVAFANTVVGVSNAVADELRTLFPRKRIIAIPNWISDVPAFQPRQSEGDTLRILFVGRIARLKGLHVLIEALRGVPNATLTVVGDGDDRIECERAAKGLPVTFLGFQSMPQLCFNRADLILNPSLGPEGSSMVALEAMAMSLPIIMSDIAVFREVANDGSAALLFKSGDSHDLCEKILSFRDAALRRGYAERGHSWVLQKHSSTNAKREYLSVFGVSQSAARHTPEPADGLVPNQPLHP